MHCPSTKEIGGGVVTKNTINPLKKLEVFGGYLLSEDDHLLWAPPYWNINLNLVTKKLREFLLPHSNIKFHHISNYLAKFPRICAFILSRELSLGSRQNFFFLTVQQHGRIREGGAMGGGKGK